MGKIKPFNYNLASVKPMEVKQQEERPVVQLVSMEDIAKMIKGDKGDPPSKEELLTLIQQLAPTEETLKELISGLIPPPVEGKPGLDYVLTTKDKKEIASKIDVPVVEKVIERITLKDTPQEVRDKLESLKKGSKLSINAIEELAVIIEDIYKRLNGKGVSKDKKTDVRMGSIYGGQTQSVRFIDDETPEGIIDGVNTIFNAKHTIARGSLKVYLGTGRLRVGQDYTLVGRTVTFTLAPQIGEVLLFDYRT